jgi:hypothetical protein
MRIPHRVFKKSLLPLLVIGAALIQGCHSPAPNSGLSSSSAQSTSSGSSGTSTPIQDPPPAQTSFAATQLQTVSASLNQSPQYALTSDDVALLQSQGVLSDGDSPALSPLVKQ